MMKSVDGSARRKAHIRMAHKSVDALPAHAARMDYCFDATTANICDDVANCFENWSSLATTK